MRWLVSVGAVACGHVKFWKLSLLLLLVTAVIWSTGMCMTPGDSRAAVIPEPLPPALHDLLQGGWGENSGLQKNPNVQFDGKGPTEAVQALGVESLQRCPEWGAGTAQLCSQRDSLVSAFSLQCQQFRSWQGGKIRARLWDTASKGSGEAQPSLLLPGVGKLCRDMRMGEFVSRAEPGSRESSIHAPAAEQGEDLCRAPCKAENSASRAAGSWAVSRLGSTSDLFDWTCIIMCGVY